MHRGSHPAAAGVGRFFSLRNCGSTKDRDRIKNRCRRPSSSVGCPRRRAHRNDSALSCHLGGAAWFGLSDITIAETRSIPGRVLCLCLAQVTIEKTIAETRSIPEGMAKTGKISLKVS